MSLLDTFRKLLVPILCSYLLFQVCSCFKQSEKHELHLEGESETGVARKSKNLFPFVWVTFQPSPCGSKNEGVCMQRGKCTKRGGTAGGGSCQDGFGECCMFTQKCDVNNTLVDVNQLVTALESPTPFDTQCTFRFRKEPNICQIRLDFEIFDSARADGDGMCDRDKLRISNSINLNPEFSTCGNLAGQHMYLTYGTQDTIEVTPMLTVSSSRYKIIATRIPCNSINRAPDYCLQYFTTPTGTVKSFDYGGQQQDSQKYTICVKPTTASTSIKWTPCTMGVVGSAFSIVSPSSDPLAPIKCDSDWVQAKGEQRDCIPFSERTSKWKPYELIVSFDDNELGVLPVEFNIPVDPLDCPALCNNIGDIMCGCVPAIPPAAAGTSQSCQCVIPPPMMAAAPNTPISSGMEPDTNNTGFCLDYTQL